MLALVDGIEPQVLNLKNILEYYIKHRFEVITRRTQFDLNKAKDRAHILEGSRLPSTTLMRSSNYSQIRHHRRSS
jgi:DNA gyrase subunit A